MGKFKQCVDTIMFGYPLQAFALVTGIGYILGGWGHVATSCAGFLTGYFISYLLRPTEGE